MSARAPVRTVAELATLDDDEMVEGYRDGYGGEPEPGGNRSKAYWHGWRNGASDRNHTADEAQHALAREIVAAGKTSLNTPVREETK